MEKKILALDLNLCTGRRSCELRCSFNKDKQCDPSKASIRVVKLDRIGIHAPIFCLQCEEPLCQEICPTNALSFNPQGLLTWNKERCVGCHACLLACPFGAIWASRDREILKCNLCDGDPYCVRCCETGALLYLPISEVANNKNYFVARKMAKFLGEIAD